jgi:hypothetical protein
VTTAAAAPTPGPPRARAGRLTVGLVLSAAVLLALAAGELVARDRGALVLGVVALLVPVLLWKKPESAAVLLLGAALVVEQFPEIARPGVAGATARLPLFHGLGGVRISDLALALMIAIWVARRGTGVLREPPRSPLAVALLCFTASVVLALGYGLATGGSLPPALIEVRSFLYLALAYFVTATMLTTARAVRAVLWTIVIGSGLKGLQGLYIFLSIRDLTPRPEAVLGHEESLFLALFVFVTAALWLYDMPGPLRRLATALAPVVVAADLANGRRVAWLIIAVGLVVLLTAGLIALPRRRRFLSRATVALLLLSAVYFPAYWDKTGGFAQPARAFRSAVSPHPRDAASNLYRIQEDANLRLNIRAAGPLGDGFGHRIDYVLPIEDISDIDPYIAYIPHNGVFHLFLRLGLLGAVAFWALIGVAIVTACRLARSPDKELGLVGMVVACAVCSYVVLGANDQGFLYYRVAFAVGVLLGLLEVCSRLQPRPAVLPALPPGPPRRPGLVVVHGATSAATAADQRRSVSERTFTSDGSPP